MNKFFRSLTLSVTALLCSSAFAQPVPPYSIYVWGVINGGPANTVITITNGPGTLPNFTQAFPMTAGFNGSTLVDVESLSGSLIVSAPCNGALLTDTLPFVIDPLFPDSTILSFSFNCGNSGDDCLGVPNGPAQPGTPCDDNDPWTILDTWTADCVCLGLDSMMYDCLGIANGPNTFGTPCTQPATGLTGYWNNDCVCVADTASTECSANFWVMQAYTYGDSINNPNGGGAEPIPNEVWVWNLSSGGEAPYTYLWSFGDGTSSVDPYPTHVYANGGPYQLCLTIADASGCTSTYCDDVSVDDNGIYTGLIVDGRPGMLRSGFTIRVISELPMAVAERNVVDEVSMWPNPVEDIIGLSFHSSRSANLILSIIDLNGRMIRSSNSAVNVGNNRHTISVADLEAGMYLLQISDGAQSTSRRFVKN
jgi:hypothetical protein